MITRAVTFGADARTARRHPRREAVPASHRGRTERASARHGNHSATPRAELSSWSGVRLTENPRSLLCGRSSLRTRDTSPRQLPTDLEHVARPTDIRLIIVDACFRPAAELSRPHTPGAADVRKEID